MIEQDSKDFFFCVIGISLIKLPPEKSGTCLFVCWFLLSFYGWDRYDGGGPPLGGGVGDGWLARSFLSFWVGVSDRGIVGCFRLLGADGEKKSWMCTAFTKDKDPYGQLTHKRHDLLLLSNWTTTALHIHTNTRTFSQYSRWIKYAV